jgi:hypothetical protein
MKAAFSMTLICTFISKLTLFLVPLPESILTVPKSIHVRISQKQFLDECLEKGSKDNMTTMIVKMPAQAIGEGGGVRERRRLRMEAADAAENANEDTSAGHAN